MTEQSLSLSELAGPRRAAPPLLEMPRSANGTALVLFTQFFVRTVSLRGQTLRRSRFRLPRTRSLRCVFQKTGEARKCRVRPSHDTTACLFLFHVARSRDTVGPRGSCDHRTDEDLCGLRGKGMRRSGCHVRLSTSCLQQASPKPTPSIPAWYAFHYDVSTDNTKQSRFQNYGSGTVGRKETVEEDGRVSPKALPRAYGSVSRVRLILSTKKCFRFRLHKINT